MNSRQYRPEIDGLRALSVMGVVLFHFGFSVPGGFIGVDVFFVISGYLITGILLRNLRDDRLSMVDFWARRIRRIAPAAVAMVLGTLALGAYFLTPGGFESLGRTMIAHALLAANCYFSQDQGYFAESAESLPLLHTWSLAVEEQFYLIFPLILIVVWKIRPRAVLPVVIGLALWSLIWSYFKVSWNVREAFFLLPPRGWELLAGAILAGLPSMNLKVPLKEFLSGLGLVLIVVPMALYHKETPFPGIAALPPVLGAALFILGNEGQRTLSGKLLSVRPAVFIGLISYSLYLWHWPLMVYARFINRYLTMPWQLALLAASFLLGWLSWKFVETPFRSGGILKTSRRCYLFAGASMAMLLTLAAGMLASKGFPQRLPENVRLIMEDVDWEGEELTLEKANPVVFGKERAGPPDFILWGDSHGVAATPGAMVAAENLGLKGWAFLNNGTPPVPGLWRAEMGPTSAAEMVALNEEILAKIIASGTHQVILVSRWVVRCEGYNDYEMVHLPVDYRPAPMAVNHNNPKPDFAESSQALMDGLISLSARLREHGIDLAILQQVPESIADQVAFRFYAASRFPLFHTFEKYSTPLAIHRKRESRTMAAFAKLPEGTLEIIDPTLSFYPEGDAVDLKLSGKRTYYRDDDHLARFGSVHYLTPVFEKALVRMLRDPVRD